MSLEFWPGITTSSPASRDPYAQYRLWRGLIPAITHSSTPSLIDHNISRRHNPKPTTAELNTKRRPPYQSIISQEDHQLHSINARKASEKRSGENSNISTNRFPNPCPTLDVHDSAYGTQMLASAAGLSRRRKCFKVS
jgi:hypothetical protein